VASSLIFTALFAQLERFQPEDRTKGIDVARPITRRSILTSLLVGIASKAAIVASAASGEADEPSLDLKGEVLGRFKDRHGFERIYVKLSPGLRGAKLVAIAQAWHVQEPQGWIWFLDDDEKADEMLRALPEVQQGNIANYPVEWVAAHSLGHIQMELLPGGCKRWTLMPGAERAGTPLAVLHR